MILSDEIKCKTCGEPLDISKATGGVIKCAVCGYCYTLSKRDATQKVMDYLSHGETYLDTAKFDDAYTAFSKAAELDKTEPEAYWGMALAEFKIQYLKDEVNNRLQPICHEITDKDFTDSANFLKASLYATEEQREEYRRKGDEIDRIKKEFYKLKQTGLDYDCFICVKVTDEKGGRTQDYKYADDIYFKLKGKGYKPFFSERELEGATGADYEARILYALKSAECMLVICFDEAYLRTKWVKNEYSRFLKLVNDEEKESDSIALVFKDKTIEKLPGKHGKIQGIWLNDLGAMEKITAFVENHTPEARRRREEQAKRKDRENEDLRNELAELKKLLLVQQVQQPKQEIKVDDKEQKEQLKEIKKQPEQAEKEKLPFKEFEIENGVLIKYNNRDAKEAVIPHGVTSIGEKAFSWRTNLTSIIIPDSVTRIDNHAFNCCRGLTNITIPNSVISIDEAAFIHCTGLTSIVIPKNVIYVGKNAFADCIGLKQISCSIEREPDNWDKYWNIKDLDKYSRHMVVWDCKGEDKLSEPTKSIPTVSGYDPSDFLIKDGVLVKYHGESDKVVIPKGVRTIGENAFYCAKVKEVVIPEGVVTIENNAFEFAELEKVVLPDSLQYIGDDALSVGKFESIKLPEGLKHIGNGAFNACNALTSVVIPSTVENLGDMAFYECRELKSVEIVDDCNLPSNLKILNKETFYGCEKLEQVNVPSGVTEIGDGAFWGCSSLTKISIPGNTRIIGVDAFNSCSSLNDVFLAHGVKCIGGRAFRDCTALTEIKIPDTMTHICGEAFYGCKNLKRIVIPTSVTNMYDAVFEYDFNLTIFCRAKKQPKGWDKDWDIKDETLVRKNKTKVISRHKPFWGYVGN